MFVRYTAVALDGEAIGGWTTFFQKLAQSTRTFVIRENEVLMMLRTFSDAVVLADTLTFQTQAPMSLQIGGLFCTDAKQIAEVAPANSVPIGFDAVAGANKSGTTVTVPITVANNGNRVLVVGVGSDTISGDCSASSVTYNGVALTLIDGGRYANQAPGDPTDDYISLWYLLAPDTGAHNVVVSFTNTPSNGASAVAISLYGVAQRAPEAFTKTLADANSPISANITTLTNNSWLVDVFGNMNSATNATAGSGQTERARQSNMQDLELSTKLVAIAGPTSTSWTWDNTWFSGLVVAAFAPASP